MPFVQATVVRAQEPSSARPGDRAIILADGSMEGFVGGHCAAGSVRTAALGALGTGESLLLRVLPDGNDAFPESPGASIVVNPCLSGGALEIYLEPLLPPAVLHVTGTSPTAEALAGLADGLGFVVRRAADAGPEGATAVVVATHGDEVGPVRAALDAGVGFVGVVCSHTRGAALLAELALPEAEAARVHLHVGLDIGARTPPELALSILAAVVRADPGRRAVRVRRVPGAAADRGGRPGLRDDRDDRAGHRARRGGRRRPLVLPHRVPHPLPGDARVTGPVSVVVLAAGGSRRLGRPKQLLDFRGATLLDATLATARAAGADQVVVALGGAADEVAERVDLAGLDVVLNPDFGDGCATSIRTALTRVRDDAAGVVLLLGDQPGVTPETVRALVAGAAGHAVGVCAYDDAPGHPLWFDRSMFATLSGLHGDKAVWKIVEADEDVVHVPVPGPVPRDVDTWADYQALLGADG